MTREMQDTDRALVRAEHDWLLARGWTASRSLTSAVNAIRYAHTAAPPARSDYAPRDALAMTRAEPLRYMGRHHTAGPA